jgi:hypothetical protein
MVERAQAEAVGAHDDQVGVLAGRQAADAVVEPDGARALDRGEGDDVAAAHPQRIEDRAARRGVGVVERPLDADRRAHRAEHVPAVGRAHVDRQARTHAGVEQAAGGGPAVAHLHLDVGGHGCGAAASRDQRNLVVGDRVAVHVSDVGAHQPFLVQPRHRPAAAPLAVADVDGDARAELARQREIVPRDRLARELGAAQGHRHRDELVVGREVLVADAACVLRVRDVAGHPVLGGAAAVREDRARRTRAGRRPPRRRAPAC